MWREKNTLEQLLNVAVDLLLGGCQSFVKVELKREREAAGLRHVVHPLHLARLRSTIATLLLLMLFVSPLFRFGPRLPSFLSAQEGTRVGGRREGDGPFPTEERGLFVAVALVIKDKTIVFLSLFLLGAFVVLPMRLPQW